MTVSSLSNSNGIYYFRMYQGAYDYNITLIPNSDGYVSEITIDTMLPMLAVNALLQGDMSSGRYYDETYASLRNHGFASDIADAEAHRRAESYASDRLNKLDTMFNIYGTTGNNYINSTGVMILAKIREEDIDKADLYLRYYKSPRDAYYDGVNYFTVNHRLMGIINSGLVYLYASLGLNQNETNNLSTSFTQNSSSTYCSKTNRTIKLRAETTLKGDSVKIYLSAQ